MIQMRPTDYWRDLLENTGYKFQRAQTIQGVTVCIRADKPPPYAGSQMSLNLDFEAY
jgi:hypothetical protein